MEKIVYNSHGKYAKLGHIVDLEEDRGNSTFDHRNFELKEEDFGVLKQKE